MSALVAKLRQPEVLSSLSIMALRVAMLAAKFILSLFMARYLGLEELGVYGLILGASGTVQALLRLGVFNTLARDAVHQPLVELVGHLRHYGIGVVSIYILLAPAMLFAGDYFGHFETALLVLGVIALEHLAFDIFILTNNLNKPLAANVMLSLQSASWIYLYVILAFFIPSLRTLDTVLMFWMGGGLITVGAAWFATRNWPWKEAWALPLEKAWYLQTIVRSWRLYACDVMAILTVYLDRFLITFFLNLEVAGVYVLFSQVVNAICNLVGAGVIQMYRPQLLMAYKEGDAEKFESKYKTLLLRAIGSATGLSIMAAIVVPFMISFTKQPLAMDYLPLLWMMLFALLFRVGADVVRNRVYARHQDKWNLYSNGLGLLASAGIGALSMWLIGVYGAVITTILSFSAMMAYIMISERRYPPEAGRV